MVLMSQHIYLPDIGTRSADELLGVLPLVKGDEILLGAEDPNPTDVGRSAGLDEVLRVDPADPLPPDLMLDERRTDVPCGEVWSELSERLEPGKQLNCWSLAVK